MQSAVRKFVQENHLIDSGQAVLVALSGGPDSVALLHILSVLEKPLRLRLGAVYVNHGLRPRSAKKEELFCEELCQQLQIELQIVRTKIQDLAHETGQGLEETGRDFRYGVFEAIAQEDSYQRIALAHHADDRVETILFNLFRGSARNGLIGMPVRRGKIVRPLFELSKEEILDYLKRHKLSYCLDQSNEQPRFTRNFLRNKIIPQIKERVNSNLSGALLNLAEIMQDEEEYLYGLVEDAIGRSISFSPGGKLEVSIKALAKYPLWQRRRLLRHCVATVSTDDASLDKRATDRLVQWSVGNGRSMSLPHEIQVTRTSDKLVFYRQVGTSYVEELRPGRRCRLEWPRLDFRCQVGKVAKGNISRQRRSRQVHLDRDQITLPLILRNARTGDRFQPLGMQGTKKVAEYLQDKKIPAVYRDEIPVVCDNKGILWVVGHEISDRAKVAKNTKEVLSIEFSVRRSGDAKAV